jgi:two-component system NtrC family sensor kinase
MRQRSTGSDQPSKSRRRKTLTLKRHKARKAKQAPSPSESGAEAKIAQLVRERDDALEQQRAATEVLKIISASPTELRPVLEVIVKSAARFCDANDVTIFELDGQDLCLAAHRGPIQYEIGLRLPCTRGSVAGRTVIDRKAVHVIDLQAEADEFPEGSAFAKRFGHRTTAGVPLLREGVPIGMIQLRRTEVNPFTDKQIALLGTFAAQAVIAIENARLFSETKEALARQTATAEVLKVIASSPGDLAPMFDVMLESATRLCEASHCHVWRFDGQLLHAVAVRGDPQFTEWLQKNSPIAPIPGSAAGRIARGEDIVHVVDRREEEAYSGNPVFRDFVDSSGTRASLSVALRRDGTLLGMITVYRQEVRPFSDKQIALLQNFAAQAVLAMENARLVIETRDALEQQTATADVLKVISRSAFDLQTVLDTLVESAAELLGAPFGTIFQKRGDLYHLTAQFGYTPEMLEYGHAHPIAPEVGSNVGRTAMTAAVVQIPDVLADPDFTSLDYQRVGKYRAMLGIPIMREGKVDGVFSLAKPEPGPFAPRQVLLVQTFADQAAIAIENARLFEEVQAKTRDLAESLQQQTATADVLKVISRSAFDLRTVLNTLTASVANLCDAEKAFIMQRDGDAFIFAAAYGFSRAFEEYAAQNPMRPGRGTITGRAALEGRTIHIPDVLADPEYDGTGYQLRGQYRSGLGVPLLRDGETIGVFGLTRTDVRPFTEKQIELVTSFADQAVIAIENHRLVGELRESLQQQTATGDVLKIISRSSVDLQKVLDTLCETVARLCRADQTPLYRRRDDKHHLVAAWGMSEEARQFALAHPLTPGRGTMTGRVILERRAVHMPDVLQDPEYTYSEGQKAIGYRTLLGIPLLREDELLGVFAISRRRVEPFSDKEIELAISFADQAVIAIENARLFEELRQSLQQQTATADVLKVISQSAFDLGTVLQTLVESAAHLCEADKATISRKIGEFFYRAETYGFSDEFMDYVKDIPVAPERGSAQGRALLEGKAVHILDVEADPEFTFMDASRLDGFRTVLAVPILREGVPIGALALTRSEVRAFTDKQVELVSTFADQAAIAIENARLVGELRERQAELRVTFDNMGDGVAMFDASARLTAWNRNFQEILELPDAFLSQRPTFAEYFRYLADSGEYSADLEADLSRANQDPRRELRFERTRPDGRVIEVRRNPVPDGGFVLIYADITERKRAEEAVRLARDAAETALRELQTAQDRLVQTQKLASLGQLTAGIAHEIKNPLNFVNNFSALSVELADELSEVLKPVVLPGKLREEVKELTSTLKDNLGRVVQHGKRADSIVKNMLLHSREGSGEHRPIEINAIIDESLNLAYHGARAEGKDFNITLERDFDPAVGVADIYPQEITRVLLNLISNGFYAATQRAAAAGNGFEPSLMAATRSLGDRVEVRIRDNGTGIPPEIQEKIFNPFFTTKPAGEGTGLGLSMSHDIVVKQHGGTIEVVTEPGSFTEFIIKLPRVMPAQAAPGGPGN